LAFFVAVPFFSTATTSPQSYFFLSTSSTLPLQGSRLTINLMAEHIAVFTYVAAVKRYSASTTGDLWRWRRTNGFTAPTLILF